MAFKIKKEELISIVSTCQDRSYAEEIELLEKKGDDVDWLAPQLDTHSSNGISNDEESLIARKLEFGSN